MNSKRTAVICNPTAGSGLAQSRWEKFNSKLKTRGLNFHSVFTQYRGHATELVRELLKDGFTRICSFGGDGTVNEILQGFVPLNLDAKKDIELVYLGAGSSNDFNKKFPDEKDWTEKIVSDDIRSIDICQAEYYTFQGEPESRYFINNSSIGVISLAGQYFNDASGLTKKLKQFNVDVGVVTAGLKAIIHYQPLETHLTIDGREEINQLFSNLTIYKTPYFGGGMYFNRSVKQDDGKLAVALVRYASKLKLINLIPALYAGTVFEKEVADYLECKSLQVHSNQALAIETDGEIVGYPPVRYSIMKQAIRVVL